MLSTMTPFRMILLVISLAIFINTASCGKGGGGGCFKPSSRRRQRQERHEGRQEHQEHEEHEAGPSHTGYETGSSDDGNSRITRWSGTEFHMDEEPIGYGTFGQVWKATSKSDNEVYAIKKIYKEDNAMTRTMTTKDIKNEIAIQLRLDHIFVVRLYHAYQDRQAFYLQLEMVEGGELFDLMNTVEKFDENVAKFYAAEVICGLEYLHNFAIAYRDLKANNVLLTSSGHIKIADFGLAKQLGREIQRMSSIRGGAGYMAPEIQEDQPYGTIVDSWSLGALIYTMIYGWNNGDAISRLSETKINYRGFLPDAKDLLKRLLVQDPHKRSTIAQIKTHKWFQHYDWSQVVNQEYLPPYRPVSNGYYYTWDGEDQFIPKEE